MLLTLGLYIFLVLVNVHMVRLYLSVVCRCVDNPCPIPFCLLFVFFVSSLEMFKYVIRIRYLTLRLKGPVGNIALKMSTICKCSNLASVGYIHHIIKLQLI